MRLLQLVSETSDIKKSEHWTRAQLEAHQAERLKQVREYAYAKSPFYQKFHQGLFDAPLEKLPVLNKETLMSHFDEVMTDRNITLDDVRHYMDSEKAAKKFHGKYRIVATSGSTGKPGIFLFNDKEWTSVMAFLVARLGRWTGLKPSLTHRAKTAAVASSLRFHMSSQGGSTFLKQLLMPGITLAASESTEELVSKLNKFQPDILSVYASIGRPLANAQMKGDLSISPRVVLSGSEVLTAEVRALMEKAWGNVLFNTYAATEVGGIALECDRHEGMHIMEDRIICEVVDANNNPVAPGEYGSKLLITALFKYAQPLIRYEISDSVRLSPTPCSCGQPFVLIDSIQGRSEEYLKLKTKNAGTVSIHPIVFHKIMDTQPIDNWQLIKKEDSLDIVVSGTRAGFSAAKIKSQLKDALAQRGAVVPTITIRKVASIKRGASGKINLIKPK